MAFNSNAYYANKHAREAWKWLDRARKARTGGDFATPACVDWEKARVPHYVRQARNAMHLSLVFRRLRNLQRRQR